MISIRRAGDRGHFNHGWLDTSHTFSFGEYQDQGFMGFRSLRVINEDRVKPGRGFGTHGHRDMEIITYVLEGALAHTDNLGTGSVIRPGEVQRMTAGTGVMHGEANPSPDEPVHFLQIWILPEARGLAPSYEQRAFPRNGDGGFRLVASRDARDGSLTVHQDVDLYTANLTSGSPLSHRFAEERHGWLQVVRGEVEVNGQKLVAGDGAAISGEKDVTLGGNEAEILLFDLA